MEEGKPSWSALTVAMTRAAHLSVDSGPKILNDSFAMRFSGVEDEDSLLSKLNAAYAEMGVGTTPELFAPTYRAFILIRQRYVEDELVRLLSSGIAQFVVMGAGLDSFAYRRRDLEKTLKVFEVDLPSTQQWKKSMLRRLGISSPDNLIFVPVDFNEQTLMDQLCAFGFKKDVPAFFSWLGVTVYLTKDAIFATLAEVAEAKSGSEIVFEYSLREPFLNNQEQLVIAEGRKRKREPWVSLFDPVDLMQHLQGIGFTNVTDFGAGEAYTRYLADRSDELSASKLKTATVSTLRVCHLMKARVV